MPGPKKSHRRRIRAERRFETMLESGQDRYQRWRHLPRLVRVEFGELDDHSVGCVRAILDRLDRAIAHERRRARAGHWAYDANRHIALVEARRGELECLRTALGARPPRPPNRTGAAPDPYELSRCGSAAAGLASRMREALVTETNMS
jgi:hypothetical protein